MIKDITIGQYFPGDSFVHSLDPRFKIAVTAVFICTLFAADTFIGLAASAVFFAFAYILTGLRFRLILRSIKPIVPIILFTGFINLFFIKGIPVLNIFGIIISDEGLRITAFMIIRIILLICGSSLLTYTTSPIVLTDAIESMLRPLNKLHFPVHELAMMMTIALRFIPTLIEETDKIMSAQKARGAELDSGSVLDRARAMIPILIPLFVSSFRRAEELALAMECRCYRGGDGRTKLRTLSSGLRDYIALGASILVLCAVLAINIGRVTVYAPL